MTKFIQHDSLLRSFKSLHKHEKVSIVDTKIIKKTK